MKKGQNLIEYILIFMIVALAGYAFISRMDFNAIKNYIFAHPSASSTPSQITIEEMTR